TEQRLLVELRPGRPGLLTAQLRLTTDLPAQPELLVPVVAMALAR
ncbi:MAG: hypothetical protein HUU35_04030, partial [Armatimonadetes bacterium]|nr:hypothetical protein [Armatimonadota bacterium]